MLRDFTCAIAPACRVVSNSLLTWHTEQSIVTGWLMMRSRSNAMISILLLVIIAKNSDIMRVIFLNT